MFQEADIPRHGLQYSLIDIVGCRIPKQPLRLTDISLAVTHVARAEVAIDRGADVLHAVGGQGSLQGAIQILQRGAPPHSNVVHLVARCHVQRGGSQQIGLHGVLNKAKVTAGFAVAVDEDLLAFDHGRRPFGDDGGVGAAGVLAWAKDIEVAQTYGVEAVATGEYVGVELIDVFGDGVGR